MILELVGTVLEGAGYKVETAESAEAALSKLGEFSFSVILSDVMMPGLSGIDLLNIVKEQGIQTRLILMSGGDTSENYLEALRGQAYNYLENPFSNQVLIDAINEAAGR